MRRPRHIAAAVPARFRRAVALLVALLFAILPMASLLAQGPAARAADGRVAAIDAGAELASHRPGRGDPGSAEATEDPRLDHLVQAMIVGDPDPYALAVVAGLIGIAAAWPEHPSLRSHRTAPPIRPPRT